MISETMIAALQARGLDPETADRLGLASATRSGAGECLIIPFVRGGETVRRKYRTMGAEKRFWQDEGGVRCAWNEDVLRDESLASQPLIIAEGELDALSAIQAGFQRTISVPDGAPPPGERSAEDLEQGTKYQWLRDVAPFLTRERCPEIILAADGDDNGAALMHDLSVLLGRYRCKFLTYPRAPKAQQDKLGRERCKDLNEVLQFYGQRGVVETVSRAQWLRVDGVYRMEELPPLPPQVIYEPPFDLFRENFKVRLGDFAVFTGTPGFGKALALDTPIPTPAGWTTMGALSVGDELFDERGNVCRVTYATPVQLNRRCYRLRFDDGSEVVADADHRWLTTTEKARRSALETRRKRGDREGTRARGSDQRHKRTFASVVTTAEIAGSLRAMGKTNHQIGLTAPVEGVSADLPIDPYLLGVWLGDGTSSAAVVTCGDEDIEEMKAAIGVRGQPMTVRRHGSVWSIGLTTGYSGGATGQFKGRLRLLGLLNNKHIPPVYLRAAPEDRLALLQGLMDTDGHISRHGHCEFTSTNEALARGVFDLALGLGLKARIYAGQATLRGRCVSAKHRVCWASALPVFRLPRKRERLPASTPRAMSRSIVSCDEVASVPVRCIQVDSPSHLFLCTDHYIPTHNTSFVNDLYCRVALQHRLVIAWASFEQQPQRDHRRNLRSWFAQKREADLDDGARARADDWIGRQHVFLVPNEDEDATLDWLFEKMEVAVVRFGARIIVVDPWNELEHCRERDETETEYIGRAIRRLKRFAKAFQVHLVIVAHPTKSTKDADGNYKMPTLYDISGSANWYNKADLGVIIHRQSELDTIVKTQKSRYHELIGRPGEVVMQFCKDDRRFVETERVA